MLFSRALQRILFGVIFMHVKRVFCGEESRLQLCDSATKIKEEEEGNKNNNKTHSHCQGRQIAECRPHHHNRIATK